MAEDFSLLEDIVRKTLVKNPDPKKFNYEKFAQDMEKGFIKLGFREPALDNKGGVENFLCLCTIGGQGDIICLTPTLRELRRNFPQARITLIVMNSMLAFAKKCPYVNEVIGVPYMFNFGDYPKEVLYMHMRFFKWLWSKRFSLAFDFRVVPDWRGAIMLLMSGAKERVAYVNHIYRIYPNRLVPKHKSPSYKLLTHPTLFPKKIVHDVEKCLYLLKVYGLRIQSNYVEAFYNNSDIYKARKLIENFEPDRIRIAVGIGAQDPRRKYPIHKWLEVFERMIDKGVVLVFLGGPNEVSDARFFEKHLPSYSVLNLVGKTGSWRVDAAIMSEMDMYVGNSTGLYDVAGACRVPIVATSCEAKDRGYIQVSIYTRYFPWQVPAIVVRPEHLVGERCKIKGKEWVLHACQNFWEPCCIASIDTKEVIKAFNKMLDYIQSVRKIKNLPTMRNIHPVKNSTSLFELNSQDSYAQKIF